MIINKGLWISISLDGIPGAISQTFRNQAILKVFAPERIAGNVFTRYHALGPEGLPSADDESDFASLYWKLSALSHAEKVLQGPSGEDHPSVFNQFIYMREGTPVELLQTLERIGVKVVVTRVHNEGDDAEVEQAKQDFARWTNRETIIEPNPKIEIVRKEAQWRLNYEQAMAEADKWDMRIRWLILFPVLTVVLALIVWGAFSLHWVVGSVSVLLIAVITWWIHH